MTTVMLRDARIFDGIDPELRDGSHVLIEDERIKEVADRPIEFAADIVLDLEGKTLMPGLIDAHYHCIAAEPNIAKVETMPGSLLAQHARGLLEDSLRRGFTTVRDAGGADYGYAMAVKTGLIAGPRIFYSGRALTQTGGHADFRGLHQDSIECCFCAQRAAAFGVIADGVPEVQRAAREELRRGATQIKIMASGGVASPSDPVWNLQYSEEEIRAIVWEARSWRTYVMAHAYTAEAIARCVSFGVRSIEHGNLIDAETARLCSEKDAWVVPTLATYDALAAHGAELGFPAGSLAKLEDVRGAGRRSLEILKQAGVKVGFGTDLLGAMHRYQSTEFLIRAEVLSPAEILISATSGNATLLQAEGQLGVVAPGALADLIVVDGDPLSDLGLLQDQGAHIPLIMRGGHIFKSELD
jgi:imidazolonepropionase-like amidohydrolase